MLHIISIGSRVVICKISVVKHGRGSKPNIVLLGFCGSGSAIEYAGLSLSSNSLSYSYVPAPGVTVVAIQS